MIENRRVDELALAIAVNAHAGARDKSGEPYIWHPMRVAMRFKDPVRRAVALLHDVLEDTPTTAAELFDLGMPVHVVLPVKLLTKAKGEDYDAYLRRVASDPVARKVKLADLEDNMDVRRLSEVTERDARRLAKYRRAWEYLRDDATPTVPGGISIDGGAS